MVAQAIKPGLENTEIGALPDDWKVATLKDCLLEKPSYGINAAAVGYSEELPTYLRITDISEDGTFIPETKMSVSAPDYTKYFLEPGDIVVARTGASVGKSYLFNPEDGKFVYAGFLIRIKPDPIKLDARFLKSYLETTTYWNWVKTMSARSGQPGINGTEYAAMPIPLPPINEQNAIANSLFDIRYLIKAIDKLVEKKENIKQGAMQELLTGKRRLAGFWGKWNDKSLEEIGVFSKGQGIKKAEVVSDGLPCIRYGEIYTHFNDYIRNFLSFISPETAKTSRRIRKGDLLFAGSGETAEDIGKCVAFVGDEEAYAGGDIIIFSPIGQNSMFLGYLMNHCSVARQKAQLSQGDIIVHISSKNLAQLKISIPQWDEQSAIANLLADMDAEIEELGKTRHKYLMIKNGITQQLLTGKVRLL